MMQFSILDSTAYVGVAHVWYNELTLLLAYKKYAEGKC